MTSRLISSAALAAAALSVAACDTTLVPQSVGPLPAERYGTRIAVHDVNHGPCGTQLTRAPIIALTPPDGAMIAGYDNGLARGADPVPCNRQHSEVYEGAVFFDLTGIENVIVDSAVLRMERRPTSIPWRPRRADGFSSQRCQVEWTRVDAPWTDPYDVGGPSTGFAAPPVRLGSDGRLPLRGSFDEGVVGPNIEFNVTAIVQDWVLGRRPNHGFVARQVQERTGASAGANDDSCTNIYSNATLHLQIRRAVPAGADAHG